MRDIFSEENRLSSPSPPPLLPYKALHPKFSRLSAFNQQQQKEQQQQQTATTTSSSSESSNTPRRFISSILGGDIPYGARGHVLTPAAKKDYTPELQRASPELLVEKKKQQEAEQLLPENKPISLVTSGKRSPSPPSPPAVTVASICSADEQDEEEQPQELTIKRSPPSISEPVVRCSVIQRTPLVPTVPSTHSTVAVAHNRHVAHQYQHPHHPLRRLNPHVYTHPRDSRGLLQRSMPESRQRQEEEDIRVPLSLVVPSASRPAHLEPEQEEPIDYHVPRRRDLDEEREQRSREARRSAILVRPIHSLRILPRAKINGILAAAAGHGRSANGGGSTGGHQSNGNGSNGTGQGGQNGQNCGSNGGGMSFNGNGGGIGANGGLGGGVGGAGAGGGGGGRDGRSNYGPNSPPTGSLPPFYESLKGGNAGMNAYNAANSNFLSQNGGGGANVGNGNYMMNNLDCDGNGGGGGGGELTNLSSNNNNNGYGDSNNNNQNSKQYSLLQNAAYGIILKDEQDLEYESKMDPMSMMQNSGYGGYDVNDSMMVDLSGNVVDPLQFTATLTFSSPAEHALLDSLTDAVDLTSFLQRLPNDVQQTSSSHSSNAHSSNELDLSSNPSLTPDSVSITPVHDGSCLEPFPENFVLGRGTVNGYDRNGGFGGLNGKSYQQMENSPPSYSHHMSGRQGNTEMHQLLSHQEQQQQQQHNGHMQQHQQQHHNNNNNGHPNNNLSMSFNNHCSPLDMDSHNSNMSLPSPGSSGMGSSLDGLLPPPDAKPLIQSVSIWFSKINGFSPVWFISHVFHFEL